MSQSVIKRDILKSYNLPVQTRTSLAAQLLGLSRETLRYRIEKHNLKAPYSASDS